MNWLRAFFKILFAPAYKDTGLREDPRPAEEQKQNYLHEERDLSTLPVPVGAFRNGKMTESPYPYENQWYVGSCVAHGVALALGIERKADVGSYVRVAQLFLYRLRANYPEAGAWLVDIMNLARKYGAPLYESLPTKVGMAEKDASALTLTAQMYREAEIFRGKEFYSLETPNDIEEIAKIAQLGHGVPILIYATDEEWSREFPEILSPNLERSLASIRHCICVLPVSGWTDLNLERYITVQDSAWFGGIKLRHLSEEFVSARVFGAAYWDTVEIIGNGPKPAYTFTKVLSFGANSEEVRMVQKLLISEGLLPTDCATGYFGGRTLAGVRAFQAKYAADILIPIGLDAPTSTWGARCIAKANTLCKTK